METKYLKINPADNVVVAISDLKAGETITVDCHVITLKDNGRRLMIKAGRSLQTLPHCFSVYPLISFS